MTMMFTMIMSFIGGIIVMKNAQKKAQNLKIKDELLPVAWNPDRVMNWCMSEDEKSDAEKM